MNPEFEARSNAALMELKAHNDFLTQRCINMAAELTVVMQKLKDLEPKPSQD